MSALPKKHSKDFARRSTPFVVKPWNGSIPERAPKEEISKKNAPPSQKSKLGIPPILPVVHTPHKDWRMVDARHISNHMQNRTRAHAASHTLSQNILNAPLLHRVINRFIDNWIIQEFWFAMNKLSIVGLVTGLMFLGAIFFGVGFLTAYQTLPAPTVAQESVAWEQGIQRYGPASHQQQAQQGPLPGNTIVAGLAGGVIGNQVHNVASNHMGRLSGAMGSVQSKIPAPFQPFVNYGTTRVNHNVAAQTYQATQFSTDQTKHLFSPQGLARPQSSFAPPPAQPLPGIPQAYAGQPRQPIQPQGYNNPNQTRAHSPMNNPMMPQDRPPPLPSNTPYPPFSGGQQQPMILPPMGQSPSYPIR